MIHNIPAELRTLPQWVCAGENKLPLNPRTGQAASVTDPSTWGTFEEARNAGYLHVGFVLSPADPYAIVDLDDPATMKVDGIVLPNPDAEQVATIGERHSRILGALESYAEISQSGLGVHIICRGRVVHGVRRDKVEVYSDSRYMICTGNVLKNFPITDQQPLLTALFDEMSEGVLPTAELVQVESHLSDDDLFQMASTAANSDKFLRLWRGEWQGVAEWPSQSEADFALLSMLGFYSPDNEQVRRVFRWSALGQREKAQKNDRYLNYALGKIRAKTPPPVDFSALTARGSVFAAQEHDTNNTHRSVEMVTEDSEAGTPDEATAETDLVGEQEGDAGNRGRTPALPPGFVGQLTEYIYASAIRPVPEIALCASLALTAGVVGRSFNISGTGLNQYLIVLAKTGSGKEGAATGIDALMNAVRPQVPMIDEFRGPGAFASGQALVRVLDKNPCFVSVLGEIGLTMQQICSPHANSAQLMLKKVLLDIYAKSGWNKTLASSVYSDSDKNTKTIHAPNVTILGESTPETFYSGLDGEIIAEGLLPRFSVFEYTGPRPRRNPNAFAPPPDALVRNFGSLAAVAMAAQQNRSCAPVQQDAAALRLLSDFDRFADDEINHNTNDVARQLWNRAHLKALKMAALIAVGVNPHQPIITKETAQWAIDVVQSDVRRMFSKFDSGEIGTGDVRLEAEIKRAIADFLRMSASQRSSYNVPEKLLRQALVPFQYLRRRAQRIASFRNDRRGVNAALKQTLDAMVDGEVLAKLSPIQSREQCGTNSPVFGLGPAWHN